MGKFTVPKKNPYASGDTYMSFFIWHGKVYPLGVPITTRRKLGTEFTTWKIEKVVFEEHFFDGTTERWGYRIVGRDGKCPSSPINYVYDTHRDPPDKVIDSLDAEPLDVDVQEYIDFIENYKATHITEDEKREFKKALKKGASIRSAMPERFRDNPDAVPKPSFNDFNCPGVIMGWIVVILVIFFAGIFKPLSIKWGIRLYAIWQFTIWRRNKLYGL